MHTYPTRMKYMAPHRKFGRSVPPLNPALGPFYRHSWPKDLPTQCSVCGTAFVSGVNLSIGPLRIGSILKKAAIVGIIPCWIGALFLPDLLIAKFGQVGEVVGALLFLGLFFGPAILVLAGILMPIRRRVQCKKCGWNRYYKLVPIPSPIKTL